MTISKGKFLRMPYFTLLILLMFGACGGASETPPTLPPVAPSPIVTPPLEPPIRIGAERTETYLPQLADKSVGMVVNPTSRVGNRHLVDTLLSRGVRIAKLFAPEHGFRGTADAGAAVVDGTDLKTGLPILSLYGNNKKPSPDQLRNLDLVLFDIQDVGARFYTYISTLTYVMEACAEAGIPVMVLDRPNPNGHYVDGPVLEPAYSSFVGLHPVPVVHGMTIGEYARMVNGEGWLKNGIQCDLTVIPMEHYRHDRPYDLPVKPSPNLPNQRSILLYPSICFFEGTVVSCGRGTDAPFQQFGAPDWPGDAGSPYATTFIPQAKEGAGFPKHEGKTCRGYDLRSLPTDSLYARKQLNISYLLRFYEGYPDKENFFLENKFFDKLAGTDTFRKQIVAGWSEEQIRATWRDGLRAFKTMKQPYLLYGATISAK